MAGEQLWPEQSPEELRCPITNELMDDPVMAADGYTYDRSSIADWIEFNYTSPTTGARISSELIPNNDKKVLINQWKAAQTKRINGPCDIEPLLARVAWANSSHEACTELTNLSSIVTQNQLLIPEHKLRRMRLCLSSDESVWCPRVAQLLDSLQTSSAPANNSNNTNISKNQPVTSAPVKSTPKAEDDEMRRVTLWNPTERKKRSGNSAPFKKNLAEYLRSHPDWEVFQGQKKPPAEPIDENNALRRVTIWNPKERKKRSGNCAPFKKNLADYLRSHPDWEVFQGQDKQQSYPTLAKSAAPVVSSLLCASFAAFGGKTGTPAKEEQAHGGLMALFAATQGDSDKRAPPAAPPAAPSSAPTTPPWDGCSEGMTQVSPQMHKRKISEVGQDTSDHQLTKTCKTNIPRRPIVKALTVVRRMEMSAHVQLLAQAKAAQVAAAQAKAAQVAAAQARAAQAAARHQAELEERAEVHAAAVARGKAADAKAAAQAKAEAEVQAAQAAAAIAKARAKAEAAARAQARAETAAFALAPAAAQASFALAKSPIQSSRRHVFTADRLVQQHFQAANSKLAAFLTQNAPTSPGSSFLLSQQAGDQKPAQQPVVTKIRKTNKSKDGYLEITAAPRRVISSERESGALMFVDETKSQERCWSSKMLELKDTQKFPAKTSMSEPFLNGKHKWQSGRWLQDWTKTK